jgi:aromatic ring-cleaving dioxygenase
MQRIKGYYAHVYSDADTLDQARALCEEATQLFLLKMGRVHQRPVGRTRTGVVSWPSIRSTSAWSCRGWPRIAKAW